MKMCNKIVFCISFVIFIVNISNCDTILPCNEKYDVVTDFSPENCEGTGLFYSEHRGSKPDECLPMCTKRAGNGETCTKKTKCAPGLKCNGVGSLCEIDKESCAKYNYLEVPSNIWKPDCLPDGTYAPKQCKGEFENGRCFCYDPYGKRIFGHQWSNKAEDMTCACSRRRAELERKGRKDVTLHCNTMGNYEPLQCDSGLCWCAETKTGKVLVSAVPEIMMTVLSCYKKSEIGEQYLRQCESQAAGQAKILEELEIHGTQGSSLPFVICDGDGSFGKYKVMNGIAYCTKRDNSLCGSWSTGVMPNMDEKVNCNCARDTVLYKELGLPVTFTCEATGNYKKVQSNSNGQNYCVDSDGFPISELTNEALEPESCPEY